MSVSAAYQQLVAAHEAFVTSVAEARGSGLSLRQVAVEAGCDRGLLSEMAEPMSPPLPPVILLRGRAARQEDWDEMEALLPAQAYVTHDRLQAWHLSRGGHRLIFCDFSPRAHGGRYVTVGVAEAKDIDGEYELPLLSGGLRERPEKWVPVEGVDLPQRRLDVPRLAAWVAAHVG